MKLLANTALLIIDQQQGIDYPVLGARNNSAAERIMLTLLAHWRNCLWPVVHIKHRSAQRESVFWPEQQGFAFKPEFIPTKLEWVIEKRTPCAFVNTPLEKILRDLAVNTLVVVGASTNNSVEATVRMGGNIGFDMIVIEDGCFAFAKTDYRGQLRTADDVHAMSLANLQGEYATVIHSSSLDLKFNC